MQVEITVEIVTVSTPLVQLAPKDTFFVDDRGLTLFYKTTGTLNNGDTVLVLNTSTGDVEPMGAGTQTMPVNYKAVPAE